MRTPPAPPASAPAARTTVADSVAFVGILLYIVVVYTAAGDWITWLRPWRPALLTAALSAAALAWRWIWNGVPPHVGVRHAAALAVYTGLALASPLWSIVPAISHDAAVEAVKLALSYFVLVSTLSSARRLRIACVVLAAAACVPAQGAVRAYLAGQDLVEGYRASWHFGIFGDPNHLSMSLVAIVPLTVMLATRSRFRWRVLWVGAAILQCAAIVLTYSRGAFLGLSVALLLQALREPNKLKGVVLGAIVCLAVVGAAPNTFWKRDQTILTYNEDASAMARVHAYDVAWHMAKAHPLTGIGGDAFVYGWALYAPAEDGEHAYKAHNLLLEVLAEYGIFALAAFALWLCFALFDAGGLAGRDPSVGPYARAVLAGLCGYLMGSMFAGYKLSAELYMLAGLGGAAAWLAREQPGLEAVTAGPGEAVD
jgi:O-antigen ligase